MYLYEASLRPKFLERVAFVIAKLTLEFLVAALILTYFVPEARGEFEGVQTFPESLVLVVIYASVFAYLPLSLLLSLLWGLAPRTWRPIFPSVSLVLGLIHIGVGFVLAGGPANVAPILLGISAAAVAVYAIYLLAFSSRGP